MTYALHLAVMLGLYGMLALAANLAIGFGGLLSLSTAAFYGLAKAAGDEARSMGKLMRVDSNYDDYYEEDRGGGGGGSGYYDEDDR